MNQTAFRDGSLGILGAIPPVYARRDGILGALPPAHAYRDGSLGGFGVLGTPPPAGSYRDGSLGATPILEPLRARRARLARAQQLRARSMQGFGEYFAQNGLGLDPAAMGPMVVALGALGVVATGWYLMNRRRRRS